jgi:hypothetical protein
MTTLRPKRRRVYITMPFCEYMVRVVGLTPYQAHLEYHRIGCDPPLRGHLLVRLRKRRHHWWEQ